MTETLTETQQAVWDTVKNFHRENPIIGTRVARKIGLKERDSGKEGADLRSVVNALRRKGYPVCASGKGYYVARNERELRTYIESLRGRMEKLREALSGLEACLNKPRETAMDATHTVKSRRVPGQEYRLEVRDGKYICTCPGFGFRGTCYHVENAAGKNEPPTKSLF